MKTEQPTNTAHAAKSAQSEGWADQLTKLFETTISQWKGAVNNQEAPVANLQLLASIYDQQFCPATYLLPEDLELINNYNFALRLPDDLEPNINVRFCPAIILPVPDDLEPNTIYDFDVWLTVYLKTTWNWTTTYNFTWTTYYFLLECHMKGLYWDAALKDTSRTLSVARNHRGPQTIKKLLPTWLVIPKKKGKMSTKDDGERPCTSRSTLRQTNELLYPTSRITLNESLAILLNLAQLHPSMNQELLKDVL